VKSVEYMLIRFDRIHERGGQTDKLTDGRIPHDGMAALMHSIARQKIVLRGGCNAYF